LPAISRFQQGSLSLSEIPKYCSHLDRLCPEHETRSSRLSAEKHERHAGCDSSISQAVPLSGTASGPRDPHPPICFRRWWSAAGADLRNRPVGTHEGR